MHGWLLGLAVLLSDPLLPSAPVLPTRLEPPAVAQIMEIPAPLRQALRERVAARRADQLTQLGALVAFLFDERGMHLSYDDDATLTVAEAWEHRVANCLTFTLVTVALARELGIEAYGQDLPDTLIWRQEDRTLYHATHVNAGVWIGRRRFSVDVASERVLTHQAPRRLEDARLLAQFYNNRSVELMAAQHLDAALVHSQLALGLDKGYPTTWNNTGVVHLRAGRMAEAERFYRQAVALDPEHGSALSNLVNLLERQGNPALALPFRARLHAAQQRNPFHHFLNGLNLEQQQRYAEAIASYKRAIQLWDGEHRFHFGLARAYYLSGRKGPASRALERARTRSSGPTRHKYEAKLAALQRRR